MTKKKSISILYIPADLKKPLSIKEVDKNVDKRIPELQQIVGGYIERVPIPVSDIVMYCDEEGQLKNKQLNSRATELWNEIWNKPIGKIVGDIVIAGPLDNNGDITDIPDSIKGYLTGMILQQLG